MRLRPDSPDTVSPDPVTPGTISMAKLAVGVPNIDAFEARVAQRRESGGGMQVWTRSFPKRAAEILEGGSLYWVVSGVMSARQRVLAIEEDSYDDGSRCTRIDVEPVLVRVSPRPMRPFQGWRYLETEKAPVDITRAAAAGLDQLSPELLQHLRELCLL